MTMNKTRRSFIKKGVLAGAGLAIYPTAKSYGNIMGSNDRISLAVAGLNGRGQGHVSAAQSLKSKAKIIALCDVDQRVFKNVQQGFQEYLGSDVKTYDDIRQLLENKDIDALTIATPDHWHAPMAILAMQAGKHVYLEKPCCHNPMEGEWLMEVQKNTGLKLQIGTQQRSGPSSIQTVKEIADGAIGKPYYAKAWYANNRDTIGKGKPAQVPDWLNWDLWQGPAPRLAYKDNIVHYNWHWFWHWGTGEINNNGLHELDICRWALGVELPNHVSSSGGRYSFQDDWEFYDTQVTSFQFDQHKMINWEGRSCNGQPLYNRSRGAIIYGDNGSILVDRDGYELYDKSGNLVREQKEDDGNASQAQDLVGIGALDNYHMNNFIMAIQQDEPLRAPVEEAVKSNLLCHLGNMSQKLNRALTVDSATGKPLDAEAMNMWSREYEQGWKPAI